MTSSTTRGIFIDDNDPAIRYDGPWSLLETGAGIFGTVHELISPSGTMSLSVNFTGISLIAYAITRHGNDTASTVVPHPALYTANCLVDGRSVSTTSLAEVSSLGVTPLCNTTEFFTAETTHTLEISLAFPALNPSFGLYFDYLLITPAQSQTLSGQENVIFYAEDPVVQTSILEANVGWKNQGTWYETSVPGSQFIFQFTGVAILWYGIKPTNPQLSNATATYTLDGGDPFAFNIFYSTQLASHPALFSTQQYPYGNHTLHVVYQGNNGSIPLTLFGLIVQRVATTNAAGVPQMGATTTSDIALPTLSSSVPGPVISSSLTSVQSHRQAVDAGRLGGIVGGVIGLILVVVGVVAFFLFRRRQIRERRTSVSLAPSDHLNNEELVPDPFPFSTTPAGRGRAKISATEPLQRMPFPYFMEELPRETLLARPSAQYPPGAEAPQVRMDYDGGLVEFHDSKGVPYNAREEDGGIRVVHPGHNLPPLYTAD